MFPSQICPNFFQPKSALARRLPKNICRVATRATIKPQKFVRPSFHRGRIATFPKRSRKLDARGSAITPGELRVIKSRPLDEAVIYVEPSPSLF